jgi:Ca2+-binding EF-hand superfamily protein
MQINGVANGSAQSESTMRQEMFRRADQDGDGAVTREELTKVVSARGPRTGGVNLDELLSQIDTNEDGAIDETEHDEFMTTMSSKRPRRPSPAEVAQKLFEKADTDGDGKLTQAEMMSALPKASASSHVEALFKDADQDGDGVISQSELQASVTRRMSEQGGTYTRDGGTADPGGPRFTQHA